jgi:hypothetical protein
MPSFIAPLFTGIGLAAAAVAASNHVYEMAEYLS